MAIGMSAIPAKANRCNSNVEQKGVFVHQIIKMRRTIRFCIIEYLLKFDIVCENDEMVSVFMYVSPSVSAVSVTLLHFMHDLSLFCSRSREKKNAAKASVKFHMKNYSCSFLMRIKRRCDM